MPLGYGRSLYIMAFDHRGSFRSMFGIKGRAPTPEEDVRIADAKMMILDGVEKAVAEGVDRQKVGVLVDEEYGTDVARKAKSNGIVFAMPAEKSGQDEFDFEYDEAFGDHIEDFDPTFCKVLVRSNTDWDPEMNRRQFERLKRLSDWLHERDRKFLFELLVPATQEQLAQVGGDEQRYDVEVRPLVMMRLMEQIQDSGIEPDIWKIEGIDSREQCAQIAELVRRDGRDGVGCVVLGRGANAQKVEDWLRTGAGLPGYIGFAIGRTIFGDSVKAVASGSMERDAAASIVATNYRHFIDVWEGAGG